MTEPTDRVAQFVEALIGSRRPPRFRSDPSDGESLRVAAMLRGAAVGTDGPDGAFVERLHAQLARAAEQGDQHGVSRRRLLRHLGIPGAAALIGALAGAFLHERSEELSSTQEERDLVPSEVGAWTAVGSLGGLSVGQPQLFTAGAIRGFLIRQTDDQVIGVSAVCTHLGCLLSADAATARLNCPCHGAAFALDGAPLNPRYTMPLPHLDVRIVDDSIEVFAV